MIIRVEVKCWSLFCLGPFLAIWTWPGDGISELHQLLCYVEHGAALGSTRDDVEQCSKMYDVIEMHGLFSIISNFGAFHPWENRQSQAIKEGPASGSPSTFM